MNRVGGLNPFLVIGGTALRRKLRSLHVVELGETARRQITVLELVARNRLEEPSTDDLKTLLGRRRPPGRFHTANHVAQTIQRFAPPNATDFDVVGLGVRRAARV